MSTSIQMEKFNSIVRWISTISRQQASPNGWLFWMLPRNNMSGYSLQKLIHAQEKYILITWTLPFFYNSRQSTFSCSIIWALNNI